MWYTAGYLKRSNPVFFKVDVETMPTFSDKNAGFVALENILTFERPEDFPVAFNGKTALTWKDLTSRVSGLVVALRHNKKGRWLVSGESSFSFVTSLLALWATEQVAVLPPNHQPGTLRETAQGVVGILSDGPGPETALPLLSPLAFEGHEVACAPLRTDIPLLELFTSGTTGERQAVSKNLGQLKEEVKTLENVFGERLGNSVVFSTVSHQHIYGLLFRVLWPLCAGRPFHAKTHLFWEDLFADMASHQAATLITSPTHLERIETIPPGAHLRIVFSSGGKLSETVAFKTTELFGQTPIEVFGSTETGGVGWREQSADPESQLWRPLPGVSVSGAKVLEVTSSFTGLGNDAMVLGDSGTVFPDGRFHVDGRIDRIVKIAEKRLSLDDLEQRLGHHSSIKKARALLLDPAPAKGRRSIGVVVQLSEVGRNTLARGGQESLFHEFRTLLLQDFDATLVPRRFRLVDEFPEDSQGKVPLDRLQRLFQPTFDKNVTHPDPIQKEVSEKSVFLKAVVPENLGYVDGHFPGYPIVPGIVQLKWVMDTIEDWWGTEPILQRLEAIKFKRTLRPSQFFTLQLNDISDARQKGVAFTYQDGNMIISSGRVIIE